METAFFRHVPAPALRPFVAVAHGYRVPPNPTGLHRGLPTRHLTLVIELNAPLRVSTQHTSVASHGVVGGLGTAPAWIDASSSQEGMQYGLSPLGVRGLLGASAGELSGLVVDLADVMGPVARTLIERIAAAPSWSQRFRLLDTTLLHRLDEAPESPPQIAEAWRMLLAGAGRTPVAAVSAQVGWSRRHLSQQFRAATGVTPKQAARIARFEVAHGLLLRLDRPPLAQVALAAGYADQPHLAREWKAMAGCSVGTWLREELPFVQDAAAGAGAPSAHD